MPGKFDGGEEEGVAILEYMRKQRGEWDNGKHAEAKPVVKPSPFAHRKKHLQPHACELLDLPDYPQPNNFACGACSAMSVGHWFGVGPNTLDEWMEALGTNVEQSTSPNAIVAYLRLLGLLVEERWDMTVDDLAICVNRGSPIIVPCQDYMDEMSEQAEFDYGHYLTVCGIFGQKPSRHIACQDSVEDNLIEGEDSIQAPGKILVRESDWLKGWHDVGKDGTEYVHYGIIVSSPRQPFFGSVLAVKSLEGFRVKELVEDEEDPEAMSEEKIEAIADVLGGLYGEQALAMVEEGDDAPKKGLFRWQRKFLWESKGMWRSEHHPRDPKTGRFVPKGQEGASQAKEIINRIKGGEHETGDVKSLALRLSMLTVKQLKELAKEHGLKAKKELKAELVQKLHDRLKPPDEPKQEEQENERGTGDESVGEELASPSEEVAGEAERPSTEEPIGSGYGQLVPVGQEPPKRLPLPVQRVNKKLDRYADLFRKRGNHKAAGFMDQLRDHINKVGVEDALTSLGEEVIGEGEDVQYAGYDLEGNGDAKFIEDYLSRSGIILSQDHVPTGDLPVVATVAPSSDTSGTASRGDARDTFPTLQTLKNKLDETQHLPGLESSEDMGKLMGKGFGSKVAQFTPDVHKKLDETYGEGKWIVKSYGDEAYAGYGIFFPQYAKQIQKDAQATIWNAGGHLGKYGFQLARNADTGKIVGLIHNSGDTYEYGTEEFDKTIDGEVREWADKVMKLKVDDEGNPVEGSSIADSEHGAALPPGSFMASPAFPVVGISNEERAQGITFKTGQEGRVHIFTKDGKAQIVPHSCWLKKEPLPVVFESDDTRAMAQAAVDAINALPESERKGQLYAPDIVKTADGYKVVEANPANEAGASGYLQDNPMIIDSYVSHVTGREPAHVKFVRNLLSKKERQKSLPASRSKTISGWWKTKCMTGPNAGMPGPCPVVNPQAPPSKVKPRKEQEATPHENQLMQQAAQGDRNAFNELASEAYPKLVNALASRYGDYQMAEDAANDALSSLWKYAGNLTPDRNFWSYAHRTAKNAFLNLKKKERLGHRGRGGSMEEEEAWREPEAETQTPVAELSEQEHQQEVEAAIAALPDRVREIIKLRREGARHEEIAEKLGITKERVRQLYWEAVESLGRDLKEKRLTGYLSKMLGWFRKGGTAPYQPFRVGQSASKTIQSWKVKQVEPKNSAVRESYFTSCERDESGHCLPKGESGAEGTEKKKPAKRKKGYGDDVPGFDPAKEPMRLVNEDEKEMLDKLGQALKDPTELEGWDKDPRGWGRMEFDGNKLKELFGEEGLQQLVDKRLISKSWSGGEDKYATNMTGKNKRVAQLLGLDELKFPERKSDVDKIEKLLNEFLPDGYGGMGDQIREHLGIGKEMRDNWKGTTKELLNEMLYRRYNPVPVWERVAKDKVLQKKVKGLSDLLNVTENDPAYQELYQKQMELYKEADKYDAEMQELTGKLYSEGIPEQEKASLQARMDEIANKVTEVYSSPAISELTDKRIARRRELEGNAISKMLHVKDSTPVGVSEYHPEHTENEKRAVVHAAQWLSMKVAKGPNGETLRPYKVLKDESNATGRKGPSAYYRRSEHGINVHAGMTSVSTNVHEMGHGIEYEMPGAQSAAQRFLKYRVGDQPLQKLKDVLPNSGYADWEEGRDDDFAKALGKSSAWYAGKKENGSATEIVSMGLEALHDDPHGFASKDPEFAALILGILDGRARDVPVPD